MLKQLQAKLKELHLIDDNELILAQIQVSDYIKQQQQLKKNKEELALLLSTKYYSLVATSKYTIGWEFIKLVFKKIFFTWKLKETKKIQRQQFICLK